MEDIYANADPDKPDTRGASINQSPRSPQRFHGAAVLFLGLLSVLLLAGLISFSVHCHSSARKLSVMKEQLQACEAQLSSMTEQRNLLNASFAKKTEELQCLKKTCLSGWTRFGCSCYFFSKEKKSWQLSQKDCRDRGADLVVINSLAEQKFVSNATERTTWIGLSDVDDEGTWKWTDGTPLTLSLWQKHQPDNGNNDPKHGEEDCVHINTAGVRAEENWNDLSCHYSLPYVCEK